MSNTMTQERAIEILNPEHREHYDSIETVNEACRMGMKALEKQIPKKPVIKVNEIDCDGQHGYIEYIYCPCCNKELAYINNHKVKVCIECGQALDWSDEE